MLLSVSCDFYEKDSALWFLQRQRHVYFSTSSTYANVGTDSTQICLAHVVAPSIELELVCLSFVVSWFREYK
jgi:hypothetical protein